MSRFVVYGEEEMEMFEKKILTITQKSNLQKLCQSFDTSYPKGLKEFVWFNMSYFMHCGHENMKKKSIAINIDATGIEYINHVQGNFL